MKLAFVYAGQGSQFAGMGKDLYENYPAARAVFDQFPADFQILCIHMKYSRVFGHIIRLM